jgi:hypothetical protein
LIILFHTTRVNISILHNTDIPPSPYVGHTVVPCRHSRPAGGRASDHRCAVVEQQDGLKDEATFLENFCFSDKRERNVPLHPTVGDKTGRQRRVDVHQISSKDTSGLPAAERRNLLGISPKLVLNCTAV